MHFQKFLFFLIIITKTTQNEYETQIEKFTTLIKKYLSNPEMNKAYLSYNQYINFTKEIENEFPEIIKTSSIGETYLNNSMPLISFKSNSENKKSGILFTGMHHAREPVAMMMNLYIILHLISLPSSFRNYLLNNINIYFIPIINIDGYIYNSEQYEKTKNIKNCMARKNRNPYQSKNCKNDSIGIDLNRNYDYFFGYDNFGSSSKPCEEDFRGKEAFSEPETKNIKNFIEKHNKEIKIVINYHTWGNLVITPFNYLNYNDNIKELENNYFEFYKIYNEFDKEGNYPFNYSFGNGDKTINYKTNGDATDWFFGKMKKLSFSPELGNGNSNSDKFYPNYNVTVDIYQKNLQSSLYSIQKSNFFIKGFLIKGNFIFCNLLKGNLRKKFICNEQQVLLKFFINFQNRGFGDYDKKNYIEMKINSNDKIKQIESFCFVNLKNKKQCSYNSSSLIFYINDDINALENNTFGFEFICNKDEFMEIKNDLNQILLFNITKNIPFYSGIFLDNKTIQFEWLFDSPKINIYNVNFTETTIQNIEETNENITKEKRNKNKIGTIYFLILLFIAVIIFCIIILYIKRRYCIDFTKDIINKFKNQNIEKNIEKFQQIKIPTNDSLETSEINQKK